MHEGKNLMTLVNSKVDWLTLTRKYDEQFNPIDTNDARSIALAVYMTMYYDRDIIPRFENAQSQRFYKYSFINDVGVRVDIAEELQKQGVRIVFSGKATDVEHDYLREMITRLSQDGYRPTRVDVAFDIFDSKHTAEEVYENYLFASGLNGAKTFAYLASSSGNTFNVGSRQSPVYARAYDKGKQQRTKKDWLRLELELKYEAAEQFFEFVMQTPANAWAEVLKRFWLADHPIGDILREYASGLSEYIFRRPRTITNTEKWLYEQVLPAFQKWSREEPEGGILFLEELARILCQDNE